MADSLQPYARIFPFCRDFSLETSLERDCRLMTQSILRTDKLSSKSLLNLNWIGLSICLSVHDWPQKLLARVLDDIHGLVEGMSWPQWRKDLFVRALEALIEACLAVERAPGLGDDPAFRVR